MQYDVQRSRPRTSAAPGQARADGEPKAGRAAKSGRAAQPDNAPRLRDRLFEVLERDRALSDAREGPELDTREALDPRDAGAKSGTHARLPGYARTQQEQQEQDREPTRRVSTRISSPPPLPSRRPSVVPAAPQARVEPEDFALDMFASWIEEELVELDPLTDAPLVLDGITPASREVELGDMPSTQELVSALEPARAMPELVLDFTDDEDLLLDNEQTSPGTAMPVADLARAINTECDDDNDEDVAPVLLSRSTKRGTRDSRNSRVPEPVPEPVMAPAQTHDTQAEAVEQEPIRTRTMAKLLAGHGYRGRALSIYDYLLEQDPHDVTLLLEAEALRSKK